MDGQKISPFYRALSPTIQKMYIFRIDLKNYAFELFARIAHFDFLLKIAYLR